MSGGGCGGGGLQFRLCWRTNAKLDAQPLSGEDVVVVTKDGRLMYPDVNDNNSDGSGGLMISWAEEPELCSSCNSSSSNPPVPLVNISLLSPEDGRGDIARYLYNFEIPICSHP